ncbi:MAG: hypothetical protein B1H08_01735 [Candidatus Omnitrophica bacterium 4484_171]|nr:MAG: hypothetical protein B1H08_01735 [Candidatus Omnitrophica bacterium 4484_171]
MRLKPARYIFLLLFLPSSLYAAGIIQARSAIQISSTVSDGKYSLHEIAKTAKENGIKAVIFTDKGFMRWSYGLWPLRNIIKKTVEDNSISRYGIKHYLDDIRKIKEEFPGMIFIPGVDSSPFYYWRGSPFLGNFAICDWHKQLIAVGLNKSSDYNNIPVIGNPRGLREGIDIFKFWPFITLLIGFALFKRRIYSYKDNQGRELAPYSKGLRAAGVIIIVLSALFVLNNWPPFKVKFDAYHGDLKILPYQNFIDYVNQKRGLVFWTHPEAENISRRGKVKIETRKYPEVLLYTRNYTGFTIFPAGYKEIGRPGGIWDALLKEYCEGKRENPVWAVGTLAFDQQGDLSYRMRVVSTAILVNNLDKEKVIESLRRGRMYALKGKRALGFILDEFSIKNNKTNHNATLGDTINIKGNHIIHIKGHFIEREYTPSLEIKLIRDGKIIRTFRGNSPFDISYEGKLVEKGKSYYRIEIRSQGLIVITNPIFVNVM